MGYPDPIGGRRIGYRGDMAGSQDQTLLGIYLNDHLAGAVVGSALARRLAASESASEGAAVLQRLADEIASDRDVLADMVRALDVPIRRYKTWAAWLAERVGRLKLNGRLLERSPLSRVLELEAMRLGVEGKAAGWRTLRSLADADSRLDADRLDELNVRARRQVDELERLRVAAAVEVFGGPA
jgi:Rad3-related DNA helicase